MNNAIFSLQSVKQGLSWSEKAVMASNLHLYPGPSNASDFGLKNGAGKSDLSKNP